MPSFNKINLDKEVEDKRTVDDKVNKDKLFMKIKRRKKISPQLKIILIILAIIIVGIVITAIPAYATYKSAIKTYQQAKNIATAIKQQNVALASEEMEKTKAGLADTRKNFNNMIYLKFVPLVNMYYSDADHALKAADQGLKSATVIIDSLKPYADVLGLKGAGSFSSGSAEDRIKTAVMTMGKITPQIDNIADSMLLVKKEIDGIEPNHYPEIIFGKKIKAQLTQVRDLTDQSVDLIHQARPLIKVLPTLLGESENKKYLVLFQNDKELRPTGGFITAYSIVNIDKGRLTIERSDDIYNLDNGIANKPKAPEPILKYLPKVYQLNLRDSNLSPDFINSMDTFLTLYNKSSSKVDVDGIIAIDTNVLVSTIRILDDQVNASGLTFTTKNDPRCNCPDVIYQLEDNISRPVGYVKADRKGLIGSLLKAIMDKALSSSPKTYWGPLFQTMLMQINQKHIQFDLFDKEAQSGIEALNAAGRIQAFDGDYLNIIDTNFGGQKSNLFTTEDIEVNYNKEKDNSIKKTVTITYKNTFPPSNCDLEAGQLCLNADLRDWIRIYVPKGSQLIENESKGSQVKLKTSEDLGKTVIEGFLTVRPLGQSKITITYKLPFTLKDGSSLPVLLQKQAGVEGHNYTIIVNGKTVDQFRLFADKEMKLKL